MFEYQTLIAQLTGMDVANASLYDGGSAAAEAVLMAMQPHASATESRGRRRACIPSIGRRSPRTWTTSASNWSPLPRPTASSTPTDLAAAVDDQTACVVVQQPNFFGCLEDVEALAEVAHDAGALFVAAFDPISLGLLKRPGD